MVWTRTNKQVNPPVRPENLYAATTPVLAYINYLQSRLSESVLRRANKYVNATRESLKDEYNAKSADELRTFNP